MLYSQLRKYDIKTGDIFNALFEVTGDVKERNQSACSSTVRKLQVIKSIKSSKLTSQELSNIRFVNKKLCLGDECISKVHGSNR